MRQKTCCAYRIIHSLVLQVWYTLVLSEMCASIDNVAVTIAIYSSIYYHERAAHYL
jgi:hypothetical protein